MKKIGLVIQHEYLMRVRKKSFILMTVLTPLIIIAISVVPLMLSRIKDDTQKKIAIMDKTGLYAPLYHDTQEYDFITVDQSNESAQEYFNEQDKSLYGIVVISANLLKKPGAITFYSEKTANPGVISAIENPLQTYLREEKIKSYNIPDLDKIVQNLNAKIDLTTIKWGSDGKGKETSAEASMVVGLIFTFLIYMFIFAYGGMIIQAVVQEKSNRIMEVLVSSVKPFDLMMGKIIGVACVGLTQFILWYLLLFIFSIILGVNPMLSGMDPEMMAQAADVSQSSAVLPADIQTKITAALAGINFTKILTCFFLYFIGGYFLYASLFAAIGSMVSQQEDTQQFMMPISLLIIFAFYAGIYSMDNPDGPIAFWGSIFPLTSPIVMMIRLPFDVPMWQLILSITLLYVTFIGCVYLSAKIYRVGVLMYGKKPTVKELIKWLKY